MVSSLNYKFCNDESSDWCRFDLSRSMLSPDFVKLSSTSRFFMVHFVPCAWLRWYRFCFIMYSSIFSGSTFFLFDVKDYFGKPFPVNVTVFGIDNVRDISLNFILFECFDKWAYFPLIFYHYENLEVVGIFLFLKVIASFSLKWMIITKRLNIVYNCLKLLFFHFKISFRLYHKFLCLS